MTHVVLGHKIPREDGHADGVFAEWTWEHGRLSATNDRYGFQGLYYFLKPGEICVSPSIPCLLERGAPTTLDAPALGVFLRTGFYLGEDTPFRAVRALPANGRLIWDGEVRKLAGTRPLGREESLGTREAIDAYIELFRLAVRRRPPRGLTALPLSGGRDSRHILFELCRQGHRPNVVITVGAPSGPPGKEVAHAGAVAEALAVNHVIVRSRQRRLSDEMEKNLATSFCASAHTWFLAVRDALLEGGVQTTYDGIGGDVLSNSSLLTAENDRLYRQARYAELADELLGNGERWFEELLSEIALRALARDRAKEHLIEELRSHVGSPNPVVAFYFWNRTRRLVALSPYGILSDVPFVFSPFVDHDVFDFLSSLPATHFLGRSFHTAAISRAFPQFAGLPYAPRGSGGQIVGSLRRSVLDLAISLTQRPSTVVRRDRVLARLAATLAGLCAPQWWFLQSSYLLQLERTVGQISYASD